MGAGANQPQPNNLPQSDGKSKVRKTLDTTCPAQALAAQDVAEGVAIHNNAFFVEKDANGNRIDYLEAVHGGLTLLPSGSGYDAFGQTICAWSKTCYWPAMRRRLTI
jgi:hypothetical protein